MRLAVVVPFLNEAELLPQLLESVQAQTHLPSEMILVDDGSSDGSESIADRFEQDVPWGRVVRRPKIRGKERDRLISAAEYQAFQWGVEQLSEAPDVVVKLDSDLRLPRHHFAFVLERLAAEPDLGLAGVYLSYEAADGSLVRETHPPEHVRGPNKFYRWTCWEDVRPVQAFPGWEGIDESKARLRGWRTASFALPGGDPVHLRPTGQHDGRLRAFRRWGRCAWHNGSHPAYVVAGGIFRFRRRPYLLAGASYVYGYFAAMARGLPRVDDEVRHFVRGEQLAALRGQVGLSRPGRGAAPARTPG